MGRKTESTPQLIVSLFISGGKLRMVMQWTICGGFLPDLYLLCLPVSPVHEKEVKYYKNKIKQQFIQP